MSKNNLKLRRSERIAANSNRPPKDRFYFDWDDWEERLQRKRKSAKNNNVPNKKRSNSMDMFAASEVFANGVQVRRVGTIDIATQPVGWNANLNNSIHLSQLKQCGSYEAKLSEKNIKMLNNDRDNVLVSEIPVYQEDDDICLFNQGSLIKMRQKVEPIDGATQLDKWNTKQNDVAHFSKNYIKICNSQKENKLISELSKSGSKRPMLNSDSVSPRNTEGMSLKSPLKETMNEGRKSNVVHHQKEGFKKRYIEESEQIPPAPIRITQYYNVPFYGPLIASGINDNMIGSKDILPPIYPSHFKHQQPFNPNRSLEMTLSAASATRNDLLQQKDENGYISPISPISEPIQNSDMDLDSDHFSTLTPSQSKSMRRSFGTDDIRNIFNMDRIAYRLCEYHVQALAIVLQINAEYLTRALDHVMVLKSDVVNSLLIAVQKSRHSNSVLQSDCMETAVSDNESCIECSPKEDTNSHNQNRLFFNQRYTK